MANELVITLEDGRVFPVYEGQPISWHLYNSSSEEQKGYPRARAVIAAMMVYRPEELARERRDLLKSSLHDRMFGHNAKKLLALIASEMGKV